MKILADAKTDRVLGVHIVGADAGNMIAEAAVPMEFGGCGRGHRAHLPRASDADRGGQGSGAGGGRSARSICDRATALRGSATSRHGQLVLRRLGRLQPLRRSSTSIAAFLSQPAQRTWVPWRRSERAVVGLTDTFARCHWAPSFEIYAYRKQTRHQGRANSQKVIQNRHRSL